MKIIAIGDTHGRKDWERIVELEAPTENDFVVFIGDYFDTHDTITPHQQMENFKKIIKYKEKHQKQVILLIGNHDFHYLKEAGEQYSGFQQAYQEMIRQLLEEALQRRFLQACFQFDNLLFSHAGVTKTWADKNEIKSETASADINRLFYARPGAFCFTPGEKRSPFGDEVTQGPLWVRPESLLSDYLRPYWHIVGHTQQEHIQPLDHLTLIDTLGTSKEYLEITDGKINLKRLK